MMMMKNQKPTKTEQSPEKAMIFSSAPESPNSLPSPTSTITTTTGSSSSASLTVSNLSLKLLNKKKLLRSLFSNLSSISRPRLRLRFPSKPKSPTKSSVNSLRLQSKSRNGAVHPNSSSSSSSTSSSSDDPGVSITRPIRIATFNASLFSMAPAVPPDGSPVSYSGSGSPVSYSGSGSPRPKSILKNHHQSSSSSSTPKKSRPRVSINLPDNEISLERNRRLSAAFGSSEGGSVTRGDRTVAEVVRELEVDILALQEVKAEEERGMRPLSDLAASLGMKHYVFAESWAPQYGNAVLSKWPIKRWRVQKIVDDSDFRNVLKTTIEIPGVGELNLYCTDLDHLDESWRMKQIQSIIDDSPGPAPPHILLGGLNALDRNDYSQDRWTDIVKYCEEIGKPSPKAEVMKYLKKNNRYTDAVDFAGEFESVVVLAKGQSVQGTCKYGTRVDYVLASPGCPYRFLPGSYSVFSSKGTSDHHIVKVDVQRVDTIRDIAMRKKRQDVYMPQD